MRNRLILIVMLLSSGWRATAQIPTLTNAALVKFKQGNTVFDRSVSDLLALVGAENIVVTGTWTFSSNTTLLKDAGTYFYDDGDATKLLRFQLSGITTGTTRNLAAPNADGTIALTGAAYGGTGQSAVAQGDLLYGSATDTWARLAKNASSTRYLSNTGSSNNPAWAQVDLTNGVTGTLPGGNGGTGTTSFGAANRIPYASGTTVLTNSANLTYDGSTSRFAAGVTGNVSAGFDLNGSGTINLGSPTLTADLNHVRLNAAPASTGTNNIDYRALYLTGVLSNDGTPTGGTTTGVFVENTVSGSTKLASHQGLTVSLVNQSSNNAGTIYGVRASVQEWTTGASLDNRTGLSFDVDKRGDAVDIHTGRGVQGRVLDNSSTGRWALGLGADLQVQQALIGKGGLISVFNSRGTGNTQYGLDITNTVSGSGVTVSSAYGISLTQVESSSGSFTNYYGLISTSTPAATTNYWMYASGAGWRNYINGSMSLGVDVTTAKLFVRGDGTTSSTYNLITEKSDGTDVIVSRDDGKVGIGTSAPAEVLDVNGQGRVDALDIRSWETTDNTNDGELHYEDGDGESAYLTIGAGERRFPILAETVVRQAIDYNTNWTTGRTKAFWTVPARFNGWKVSKVYLEVSSIGSGAGDDTIEIEKGGSVVGSALNITAATHTVVLDTAIATDDIFTFEVTALSATPAKGLNISIELRHN